MLPAVATIDDDGVDVDIDNNGVTGSWPEMAASCTPDFYATEISSYQTMCVVLQGQWHNSAGLVTSYLCLYFRLRSAALDR